MYFSQCTSLHLGWIQIINLQELEFIQNNLEITWEQNSARSSCAKAYILKIIKLSPP